MRIKELFLLGQFVQLLMRQSVSLTLTPLKPSMVEGLRRVQGSINWNSVQCPIPVKQHVRLICRNSWCSAICQEAVQNWASRQLHSLTSLSILFAQHGNVGQFLLAPILKVCTAAQFKSHPWSVVRSLWCHQYVAELSHCVWITHYGCLNEHTVFVARTLVMRAIWHPCVIGTHMFLCSLLYVFACVVKFVIY